jgi:hypothetical protein
MQDYDDGAGAGGPLYDPCDELGSRDDNVDLEFDKLLRQRRQPIRSSLSGSVLDPDVLAFDVPQLSESSPQSLSGTFAKTGGQHQDAHDRHLVRLLRPNVEDRGSETQRDGEAKRMLGHDVRSSVASTPASICSTPTCFVPPNSFSPD